MLRYTEVLRLLLLICLKVVECFIFLLLMINKTSSHEKNYNSYKQNLTILQCIIKIKNYVTKNNYLFKTLIMLGKNCYRTYQFYI
jgi:hypothetical protein